MTTHNRRSAPLNPWTSLGRHPLPCRLWGVFFLLTLILGCTIPTEDISSRQVFTSQQIKQAITETVILPKPERDLRLFDNRYVAYTQLELIDCLEAGSWIANLKYRQETHDCEEYAFYTISWVRGNLQGIPFGLGLRETETTHAENLFIDEQLNVWIVDIRRHGSELVSASGAFYFLVLI